MTLRLHVVTLAFLGSCAMLGACKRAESPAGADITATTAPAAPAAIPAAPAVPVPPPPALDSRGYIMIDFASGQTLASANENARLEPASLTKLMTSYVVFDAVRQGRIKLTDLVTISEYAWRTGGAGTDGSTSYIPIGSQVPVETLLKGMIVQSGNDASIALAERVAGNETTFAALMNEYAKRLGMTGSSFGNATGLPSPLDYTTPRDMAILARALIRDFPEYYRYFAELEFTYNNITQHNRNGLLLRDRSVDGLKTGHTTSAGYCLVSSAKRGDMRLVAAVMGTPSIKAREEGSLALFNYGFSFYETRRFYTPNQVLKNARVWKGETEQVNVGPKNEVLLTLPRGRADAVQAVVEVQDKLIAPLNRNTQVGTLKLVLDGKTLAQQPLYPLSDVVEAGFFGRTIDGLKLRFFE